MCSCILAGIRTGSTLLVLYGNKLNRAIELLNTVNKTVYHIRMIKSRKYGNQFEFDAYLTSKILCVSNTLKHKKQVCKGRWTLEIINHNRATGSAAKTVELFNG